MDLLVTGHTHRFDAFEKEGRFFVNPGSATGAWSSVWPVKEGEENEESEEKKEGEEGKTKEVKAKEENNPVAASDDKVEPKKEEEKKSDESAPNSSKEKAEAKAVGSEGKEGTEEKDKETAKPVQQAEPKAAPDPTPSFACKTQRRSVPLSVEFSLTLSILYSLTVLDVQGPVVVTYVYQLIDGEVKVEKMEFRKKLETTTPSQQVGGQRRTVGTTR